MDLHEIASKHLNNRDLVKLSEEAKKKSMLLIEEQGISAIALAISKTFVEIIQMPEEIIGREK